MNSMKIPKAVKKSKKDKVVLGSYDSYEGVVFESQALFPSDEIETEIDSIEKKKLKKKKHVEADEMVPESYDPDDAHGSACAAAHGKISREPSNNEIRENLVKNYVMVLENADVDVIEITDYLWQANVIGNEQRQKICKKSDNTSHRAALRMLLDHLFSKKPKTGFVTLMKTFDKIKPHLGQMIRNTEQSQDKNFDIFDGGISERNRQIKHKVVDSYRDLVDNVDPEELLDLLFQERIISLEDKKLIQNKSDTNSTQQGTRALLEFLFYAGNEKAFVVFEQALKDNNYGLLESD